MLAAAVLRLRGVALVAMGDGPLRPAIEKLASEPRADGRVHLLPPVPPADLLAWIAAADVGAMVNQPVSRNERISTPNKLFECLAAGVPVVSSDFPGRRRIVIDDPDGPLGAVCDPTDPGAIAAALREVLDRPADATAELRRRVARGRARSLDVGAAGRHAPGCLRAPDRQAVVRAASYGAGVADAEGCGTGDAAGSGEGDKPPLSTLSASSADWTSCSSWS